MVGDDGVAAQVRVVVQAVRLGEQAGAAAAATRPARPLVASGTAAAHTLADSSVVEVVAERAGLTVRGDRVKLTTNVPGERVRAKLGHVPVGIVQGGKRATGAAYRR